MPTSDPSRRSLPQLFTDVLEQFTTLLRAEIKLARAELSDKVSGAAIAIGLIVGGAVLLIPALVILLQAAVAGLNETGLAPYWSALIVGGAALLIGIILALIGVNRLKAERLVPSRTVEQLRRDAALARDEARRGPDGTEQRAA